MRRILALVAVLCLALLSSCTQYVRDTNPQCPRCHGQGMYACTACQQGFLVCPECKGQHIMVCAVCQGQGQIRCPSCNGSGFEAGLQCHLCTGRGWVTCARYAPEHEHDRGHHEHPGELLKDTDTCFGSGKITCGRCDAQGRARCYACDGSGWIECRVAVVEKEKS
jgi:hypothetical protein